MDIRLMPPDQGLCNHPTACAGLQIECRHAGTPSVGFPQIAGPSANNRGQILYFLIRQMSEVEGTQYMIEPERGDSPLLHQFGTPQPITNLLGAPTVNGKFPDECGPLSDSGDHVNQVVEVDRKAKPIDRSQRGVLAVQPVGNFADPIHDVAEYAAGKAVQ